MEDDKNAVSPAEAHAAMPDDLEARVERAITRWVSEDIHNSPVSRDTESLNHVTSRLETLRRMICEEIGR